MEERLDPIQEEVDKEVFTDREEELARLWKWAQKIPVSTSCIAFTSQRRMGKTAILRRLCNRLFWEGGPVVPFYFQVPQEETLLSELNRIYYTTFAQQYVAFLLRRPEIAHQEIRKREDLLPLAQATGNDRLIADVQTFIHYPPEDPKWEWNHFAISAPYRFVKRETGPFFAIILDEFQEFNRCIYRSEEWIAKKIPMRDLGNSYYPFSTHLYASIIFSGSAVTMLAKQALKVFVGRHGVEKLGPLGEREGANLAMKLAVRHGVTTNFDVATTVSQMCQGNPFYITCVFTSRACPPELLDARRVERVVDFEASEGNIRRFWQRHFEENMDKINEDRLARRIVLYLVDHPEQYVFCKDLAQALGVEQQPVFDRLQLLEEADLIESAAYSVYHGIRDRMLMRHIQLSLRSEVEGTPPAQVTAQLAQQLHEEMQQIGAMLRSIEGGLNYYLGRYAEIFVENVMHRFDDREVEARRFFLGREGTLRLPDFQEVYPTRTQMLSARGYQVDIFGWYSEPAAAAEVARLRAAPPSPPAARRATRGWAVEVRNREEAFGLEDVETFLGALESLQKEHQLDSIQGWVHSRGGFTPEAQERLQAEGALMTNLEGLGALVHEFRIA